MMRLLFSLCLAALLAASPAFADGMTFTGGPPQIGSRAALSFPPAAGGGGGGSVNWTPTANPAIQVSPTGYLITFSNVPIGTAASNREVIICAYQHNGPQVTAVTVNSTINAAVGANAAAGNHDYSIWHANVPSGTTADIVVSAGQSYPAAVGIAVGILSTSQSSPSSEATETYGYATDPQVTSSSVTVPTNGVGIVCGVSETPNATPTWNTGVQDYNIIAGTTDQILLGHLNANGTPSISGYNDAGFGMVTEGWGP
jgi:hypothetical protein